MEDGFRPPAKEKNITHIFSFLLSLFQKIAIERQARPLRRWLEKNVITALSKKLISGEVEEGDLVEVGVSPDAAAKAAERRQRSKAAAAGTSDDEEGWVSVEEDGDSGLNPNIRHGVLDRPDPHKVEDKAKLLAQIELDNQVDHYILQKIDWHSWGDPVRGDPDKIGSKK